MLDKQEVLPKVYNPHQIEEKLYNYWLENNFFTPKIDSSKTPFVIVIPPPNITGSLHIGHALNNTIQDVLIRYNRMLYTPTLWLPGTDHAGIPTQMLVEKKLQKEGLTKQKLGREKFIEYVWKWKEEYGSVIIKQLQKLGCSCDWTRCRFTMDDGYSEAIQEVFIQLYNKGLIYKGKRIINWCCSCQTAVSDLEVKYKEVQGKLYYIKYPIENSDEYITVATTRPETMLGDTAVAINPNDTRYKKFVNKVAILPIINRQLKIIEDEYVDMNFGTGCLKVTPAHDPADFEIGIRHNLNEVQVIGYDGKMTAEAGKYSGYERFTCRNRLVEELKENGLLTKIEDYTHSVAFHDRCDTIIEPITSLQWFVKMKEIAKRAIEVVKEDKIKFIPDRFKKVYLDWMENIKDWCISRQIWWGHRLPVWYCEECQRQDVGQDFNLAKNKGIIVSRQKPDKCPNCGNTNLYQDEDVLDTWFSSALWPFATLGWPNETEDLNYFYPTTVLSTARDIIFLWVARMIMFSLEFLNKIPFSYVYIHSTILTEEGKRMSKSLGTGIDPLQLIDKYGADALRFSLILNCTKAQDVRFSSTQVQASRNFANKIWNASRYILMNVSHLSPLTSHLSLLTPIDKWILTRLNQTIKEVRENINKFSLSDALSCLYHFFWDEFCDWYIEFSKVDLYKKEDRIKSKTSAVLVHILSNYLKLLHPFMPFITEYIYQLLKKEKAIMISEYPQYDNNLVFDNECKLIQLLIDVIKTIRHLRHQLKIQPKEEVKVYIQTNIDQYVELLNTNREYIHQLSKLKELNFVDKEPSHVTSQKINNITVYLSH